MMNDASDKSPWILEASEATFQQDVVERSRQLLVVVDFWATWCQPCRLLGPVLEKVARDYDGKFVLVKAETEKLPGIAAGFGVEAIPAVYALRDGQLVDFFLGLRDEAQVRAWIDRLLPTPAETLVAEASALAATDPDIAAEKYAEASRLDANLAAARIGLAALRLAQGRVDDAGALIEELEKRGFLEEEAEKIKAQLHLMSAEHNPRQLESLRAAAADPKNLPAALDLANALAAARQYDEALATALRVVESHHKDHVEPARALMVDIFRLLPDDSPLVTEYRRKLSTALY
jgi:putative thioredoxin